MRRRTKKWIFRAVIAAAILFVLAILGVLIYSITSKSVVNDYVKRVEMAFLAASVSSGVQVKTEEGYQELDVDTYRKLQLFMTRSAVLAFGNGRTNGETVELLIGEDPVRFTHADDGDQRAIVVFETEGKTYRVRVSDTSLWRNLRAAVDEDNYLVPEDAVATP